MTNSVGDISGGINIDDLQGIYNQNKDPVNVENDVNSDNVEDSISVSEDESLFTYDVPQSELLVVDDPSELDAYKEPTSTSVTSNLVSKIEWSSQQSVYDMEDVLVQLIDSLGSNNDLNYATQLMSNFFNVMVLKNLKNRFGAKFFKDIVNNISSVIESDLDSKITDALNKLEALDDTLENREDRSALELQLLEYMNSISEFDKSVFVTTFLTIGRMSNSRKSRDILPEEEQNKIDELLQMVSEKNIWIEKIDEIEALIYGLTSISSEDKKNFLSQLQSIKRLLISDMPALSNMLDLITTNQSPTAGIEEAMADPADKTASILLSLLQKIAFEEGDEDKFKALSSMLTIHTASSLLKTLLLDQLFIEDIFALFVDSEELSSNSVDDRDMVMDVLKKINKDYKNYMDNNDIEKDYKDIEHDNKDMEHDNNDIENDNNDIENEYIDNNVVNKEDAGREKATIRPKLLSFLYQQLQFAVDRKYPELSEHVAAIGMDVDKMHSMFEKPVEFSIGHKVKINNEMVEDKIEQKLYIERLVRKDPFLQRESLFNLQNIPYAVLTYSNALHLSLKKHQQPESQTVLEGHDIKYQSIEIHDETMKIMIKLVGEASEYMEDFLKSLYDRPVDTHFVW